MNQPRPNTPWHGLRATDAAALLKSDPVKGLAPAEAAALTGESLPAEGKSACPQDSALAQLGPQTPDFRVYFHTKPGARVPIQSAPPFAFFTNSFSGEEVKTKETGASPPQLTS